MYGDRCLFLISGGNVNNSSAIGGVFTANLNNAPSNSNWNVGGGPSLSQKEKFTAFQPRMPYIIPSTC